MQLDITIPQFIGLLIAGVLVIFFISLIFRKIFYKFARPDLVGYSRKEIQSRWKEIEDLMEQKTDMSYRLAIIEADKLLDHTLKALGFAGSDMGQRLRSATYRHEKLRKAWYGHKLRNQIVHEASFQVTYWQAKDAMKSFYTALKELNVL